MASLGRYRNGRFGASGTMKRTLALAELSAAASGAQELLCKFSGLLLGGIDHIDCTPIPRMFEPKCHDFPDTDESQPEFDISA
jgi:hypothetical protein